MRVARTLALLVATATLGLLAARAPAEDTPATPVGDAAAGATVYGTYCTPCHQPDGTGMGGMLGANFRDDPTRLAKSDAELLTSIRNGVQGKIGAMPPQKDVLTEQQMADALAYIRATFGKR